MTPGQFMMFIEIFQVWAKDRRISASEEDIEDLMDKLEDYYEYYLAELANERL
jgi:hypothetical protein